MSALQLGTQWMPALCSESGPDRDQWRAQSVNAPLVPPADRPQDVGRVMPIPVPSVAIAEDSDRQVRRAPSYLPLPQQVRRLTAGQLEWAPTSAVGSRSRGRGRHRGDRHPAGAGAHGLRARRQGRRDRRGRRRRRLGRERDTGPATVPEVVDTLESHPARSRGDRARSRPPSRRTRRRGSGGSRSGSTASGNVPTGDFPALPST